MKVFSFRKNFTWYLYIPIWFYSNDCYFIQVPRYYRLYIPIWFYSNAIEEAKKRKMKEPLHSNLVLFKSTYFYPICLSPYIFTFQSGSIQMVSGQKNLRMHRHFTFQSGSIQIFSNNIFALSDYTFTFQSGSIQMLFNRSVKFFILSLHSNLVLFK